MSMFITESGFVIIHSFNSVLLKRYGDYTCVQYFIITVLYTILIAGKHKLKCLITSKFLWEETICDCVRLCSEVGICVLFSVIFLGTD